MFLFRLEPPHPPPLEIDDSIQKPSFKIRNFTKFSQELPILILFQPARKYKSIDISIFRQFYKMKLKRITFDRLTLFSSVRRAQINHNKLSIVVLQTNI